MLARSVVLGMLAISSKASANVNLEWRVCPQTIGSGETVEVGLYAVSDNDTDQPFLGIQAILAWDPAVLQFLGKTDNGPYNWMASCFPDDSGLEGLNADCPSGGLCDPYCTPYNDGDAFYAVLGQLAPPPPYATPEGLLVTTMVFTAVTVTPETELRVLESVGDHASTTVIYADEQQGTQVVTGELGSLTISIAVCVLKGDLDRDCSVDLVDLGQFGTCLTGPGGGPLEPQCQAADFDGDCDADLRDIAAFQSAFDGFTVR